MIVPHYDEFGIYTTTDDIREYISKLIEEGFKTEQEVFNKCVDHFGNFFSDVIETVMYED